MKIAVDAMGGDLGPRVSVAGALQASQEFGLDVVLIGIEDVVKREVDRLGGGARVTIVDAPEAVGMGDGLFALRKKKASSIRVGAQLLKDKAADAFVSMGNTAAVVYISRKVLGSLQGVNKPALALLLPTMNGTTLLLDVGANANCQSDDLAQFAVMGKVFMEQVLGCRGPRIGLMSIGEEETKGNDLSREAFEKLRRSDLNFIGNIEGKDLFSGKADIVVSDGFTGNVALKVSEGVVEHLFHLAKREVMGNFAAKIGFLLLRRNLRRMYKKFDYAEVGGAQLLGLNGVCIIGHGRSDSRAVMNAVRRARDFVAGRVQDRIRDELARAGGGAKIG